MVVVVVGMEEEMEEKKMEVLVMEKMEEVKRMVGQRKGKIAILAAGFVCRKWRRKKRKSERERRSGG